MSKYIFSINSGRAGSKYLQSLFSKTKKTVSFHEAPPVMANDHLMQLVCNKQYVDSYDVRKKKVEAIKKAMVGYENYAEANHMFIKTFFDVVVDEFKDDIRVVILRRKIPLVVKSFVELEYFGKNAESYKWMTRSDAVTRAVDPISSFDSMDIFDRTISYLIDIEARAERFKQQYPDVLTVDVKIDELNDIDKVREMFSILGLEPSDDLSNVVDVPVNQRHQRKKTFRRKVSFDEACDRIDSYISRAKAAGIQIPKNLYL